MQEMQTKKRFFCIFCNFLCPLFAFPASCSQMQVFITDKASLYHRHNQVFQRHDFTSSQTQKRE